MFSVPNFQKSPTRETSSLKLADLQSLDRHFVINSALKELTEICYLKFDLINEKIIIMNYLFQNYFHFIVISVKL